MSFSANERDREYCRNITEAYSFIERYMADIDQSQFLIDAKTQDAAAMRLQQILECASKLSTESKSKLKIDWSALVAMRNKIRRSAMRFRGGFASKSNKNPTRFRWSLSEVFDFISERRKLAFPSAAS